MFYIKIFLLTTILFNPHNKLFLINAIMECPFTVKVDISGKNKNTNNLKHDKTIKSRVLQLSQEISLANKIDDEEKSLGLACLIFEIFSEEGIIDSLKYGAMNANGDIAYIKKFPIAFPIIDVSEEQSNFTYEIDTEKAKSMLSGDGQCEYMVVFSPWDESPLFKIKISDGLIFCLTAE